MRLFRGDLLHGEHDDSDWRDARDRVRRRWALTVDRCVDGYRVRDDLDAMRQVLKRAIEMEPGNDHWRLMLQSVPGLGGPA